MRSSASSADCCTVGALTSPTASDSEEALFATSPANIAALTDVVLRNPNDPQAYNMRGEAAPCPHVAALTKAVFAARRSSLR